MVMASAASVILYQHDSCFFVKGEVLFSKEKLPCKRCVQNRVPNRWTETWLTETNSKTSPFFCLFVFLLESKSEIRSPGEIDFQKI